MVFGDGGAGSALEFMVSSVRHRFQGWPAGLQPKASSSRINTALDQLFRLRNEMGPNGATGPEHGGEPQLFLSELDKLQCLLRVPVADRQHRRTFTRNYQQLLPDMRRRYRQDVVVAALEKPSPLFVNGTRFDATPDVSHAGANLVEVWSAVLEGASKKALPPALLERFDAAYADFERKYLHFLIATEASCKAIVEDCSALAKRLQRGDQCAPDFVAMMQQLNALANTAGKGRADLGVEILAQAQALAAEGVGLPRMCEKVVAAYHQAIDYFAEVGKNMDKVDPHLARNRDLVQTLATWEESWERAKPYMSPGSGRTRGMLIGFVADLRATCESDAQFAEAVAASDVEAMLTLPQLFGAFCAHHGDDAADLLLQAAESTATEVGLEAVSSCGTEGAYRAVLRGVAAGEVEADLRQIGMRIQRSHPTAWNNFLVTVTGELV